MLLSYLVSVNYAKVIVMVLKAPFNNVSAISWRPVLLVEETKAPGENHRSCRFIKLYTYNICPGNTQGGKVSSELKTK